MRILVTGARGFVGRNLVSHLHAKGHEVVSLRRGGAAARDVFAGPDDLADIEGFADWPAEIEAIAHLGALNPSRRDPASRDLDRLRHANVRATAALARRARRENVRRMVFMSSSAVHAPSGSRPVVEADPPRPDTPYAVSKREAEASFREALADGATEGVVLRPAPVFGPGSGNLTAVLARLARTPLHLPLGGFGARRSLVSIDSLVDAVHLALTSPAAAGRSFLVADDGPLTPAGIVAALREGAGRPARVLPAPLRLVALATRLAGKRDVLEAAERGLAIDAAAIRDALGWRAQDARRALQAMAASGRM